MNSGNATFNLQLNANQVYDEIKKVEAAIKKSASDIQKYYQVAGLHGTGAVGKKSVKEQPTFFETKTYKNLLERRDRNLLKHIEATQKSTSSLRSFYRVMDKIIATSTGKPVKALTGTNAAIGATPVFAQTSQIVNQAINRSIAQKAEIGIKKAQDKAHLTQQKGVLDLQTAQNKAKQAELNTSNKILDNETKAFNLSEKKDRVEERRMRQAQRGGARGGGSSITPISFGGIYATMLGGYAVTTPIRQQMAFEREATIAAKNIDYQKVHALGGVQAAIKSIIFDAYKDPKSAASIFGVAPEKYANYVGAMVQAGIEPELNKKGEVKKQSIKNLQEMAGLIPVAMQVLEIQEGLAVDMIPKIKQMFSHDYKRWQKTNPNTNEAEFVKLMLAYVGELSRKNPVKANEILGGLQGLGAAASTAQLPVSFSGPLLTFLLRQGYKPGESGTIISKMLSGAYLRLTDPKKGVMDTIDRQKAENIYFGKETYGGLKGDAGVFNYAIAQAKENLDRKKINEAEYIQILDKISAGRLGKQRGAATGTLRKDSAQYIEDMKMMSEIDLGIQKYGLEDERVKKMIRQMQVEQKVVAFTTENLWNRTKMVGTLASISTGEALAPSTNKFLDNISKFISGYSLDDAFRMTKQEGEQEWKGLMGQITSEVGKTLIPMIMQVVLGLVGLQVLSMVGKFAGKYPALLKKTLGRGMMLPGIGLLGGGISKLSGKLGNKLFIDPSYATYANLRTMRKSGIASEDIRSGNQGAYFNKRANKVRGGYGKARPYIAPGVGALLGLGLMYSDEILKASSGIPDGIAKEIGGSMPDSVKAGLGAMLNPRDMKNLVGFYLLTSGNKALATMAAFHFANQYFKGSNKFLHGEDHKEPASRAIMRAAAIAILMSGIRNQALVYFAIGVLGYQFASQHLEKIVSNQENYKTADSTLLENIQKSGGKIDPKTIARMRAEANVLASPAYKGLSRETIEKHDKERFDRAVQNQLNITVNVEKDGKSSVEHDGGNNTGVNVSSNPTNFKPQRTLFFT